MKKLFLTLTACILTLGLWAADVSVTEKFTRVTQSGSSGAAGSDWTGDVCNWTNKFARRGTNDKLNGNQCTWITLNGSDIRGYIITTDLEGGIKAVSFNYGQFGAEASTILKWQVSAVGTTTTSHTIERDGDLGGNTGTDGDSYSHTFSCKENAQLEILNKSEMDNGDMPANGKARLLVGDITITPYLLYRNKDVTVGLKQRGYVNRSSNDFINNTAGEGSIVFSSSDESVAKVNPETGVITPVSVGDAIITATWSEGASTTYTLHVVDGIIAENFSKVAKLSQVTTEATWHGDLFDWRVLQVRRGTDDTIGLAPRIQATALRSNAGSTLISANKVEGGVKHIALDWRQWGKAGSATKMNIKFYYSDDKDNWGDAVASQEVGVATASTPFVFNEDVTGGAKNAYLKMEYTADAAIVAVMGAMKITPYLLYTTKEATLDTRGSEALSFKNEDLIDNTGATVTYSIEDYGGLFAEDIEIAADGTVTVADRYQTADVTVQAKWSDVTTTYTLHVIGKADANAHFVNAEENKTLLDFAFNNPVVKAAGSANAVYSSEFDTVATVDPASGTVTPVAPGTTTITATIPENDNFQGAVVSYTLHIAAPNFYVVGSAVGGWNPNQVPVYADSYTISNLAAGSYQMKITRNGTWDGDDNVFGYDALTKANIIAGITRGTGGDNDNIKFTLAEAGDVTITYVHGELFKVEGNFTPQVVKIVGDKAVIGAWEYNDGITLVPAENKLTASATVELTEDYYEFQLVDNGTWKGKWINNDNDKYYLTRSVLSVNNLEYGKQNLVITPDVAGNYTFTWTYGTGELTVEFPDLPAPVYYLAGSMFGDGDWGETKQLMTEIDGVWSKTVTFESTDYKEFKIVRSVEGIHVISQDWFGLATYQNITATTSDLVIGSGDSNIGITPSRTGDYGFTFDPDGNKLSVTFPTATAVDETDVKAKAEKKVVNGQLIIMKNGVRYNVIGQAL